MTTRLPLPGRAARPALLAVLTALVVLCTFAAPPDAFAQGTYTQIICGNPDTGKGTGVSGLPEGMTNPGSGAKWQSATAGARCTGTLGGQDGIPLQSAMAGTYDGGSFTALSYAAGTGLDLVSGEIYRSMVTPGGFRPFIVNQHGAADAGDAYGMPRGTDQGDWYCCAAGATRGTTAAAFSAANKVPLRVNQDRWHVTVQMGERYALTDGQLVYRVYGGKLVLRDESYASATATGEMTEPSTGAWRGTKQVTVNASDAGAGVYRALILADGVVHETVPVDSNAGKCVDVNPTNGDPYEFAHQVPCKTSVSSTLSFDTTKLPEGDHRIRVVVEDAGGNRTGVVDRAVTVDNIGPPTADGAPTVSGTPRSGRTLVASAVTWDDHGAADDPVITRRWQRCHSTGADCVDVGGREGQSYDLDAADVGKRLRVIEIATNSEGTTQVASLLTDIVARPDGTYPPDGNGIDDDGDGVVDEPGEQPPGGGSTGNTTGGSVRPGANGTNGADGRNGGSGVAGVSGGPANGAGASAQAQLTVAFAGGKARRTVRSGKRAKVVGRLTDPQGRPISGARIDVSETVSRRGARAVVKPVVTTGADGSFSFRTGRRASSRVIAFAYRHVIGGDVTVQRQVELRVKAAVRLSVVVRGTDVRYRGRVLSRPVPRSGKVVIVQGRVKGAKWQTFASPRASRSGRFAGRYRLKVRVAGRKLQFRVRVVAESGWPYRPGLSKVITRTVR